MSDKIKILIVEHDRNDLELLENELTKSGFDYVSEIVKSERGYVNALQLFIPDIILCDYTLPSFDGAAAFSIKEKMAPDTPFIFISGTIGEESSIEFVKRGVTDYVMKDKLFTLNTKVRRALKESKDSQQKRKTEQYLLEEHNKLVFHIENSPLGFIEWDKNMQVKSCSKQAEEIFGWTEKEFRENREPGYLRVYNEDLPLATDIARNLLLGIVERNSVQHRNYTKDGKVIWCEWFNSALRDKSGEVDTIMSLVQDITERKKAEKERDDALHALERRVETRTKELIEKNKNILDSINYSKRIQIGLLSRPTQLTEIFPRSFILSLPRDIISGDFFWCYERRNKKFIVVADCTGHGVPGALMSIIGNNLLSHIVVDEHIENPSEILELLDTRLAKAVKGDTQEVKDGMDIALCVVDTYFNELYFAGAYRPLFVSVENGKINELPADRHSIGGGIQEVGKKFETKRFPIVPGQRIYLSSDGYYSQFGGPKEKKFMKSRFKKTLAELQPLPMDKQKNILLNALTEWAGRNDQVDDVMVLGIEL